MEVEQKRAVRMSGVVAKNSGPETHLVSVVIPAFNAEMTIDDTLNSVRSQTHRYLEIIVVDDGSTDQTGSIIRSHIATDSRVRLISQANGGVAAARNAGWLSARSDLIAFVDADDLWAPSKISRQLAVMLAGGEEMGLVYTWFAGVDERNRIRFLARKHSIAGDVLLHAFRGNFVGHGSSPLIRRTALVAAGGFETELRNAGAHGCEDWLLYFRIAARFRFGLVPEYLTGYRVISSSKMSSDRLQMFRSARMVAAEMKRHYPQHIHEVDSGLRAYMEFLAAQSFRSRDFDQLWKLLRFWIRDHPGDFLGVPVSLTYHGVVALLRLEIGIVRHMLRNRAPLFPVGIPEV